ncbi:alpha/beta hydrolase [Solwaraspora sp. WMMA2056]|uniref:alpha/beta fold hydrolase n=1 Tax=Solwaraspora sp. WMMA2056 TaxID=3015161 RepID=UPI00259BBDA6|nr:alpha/beta hydrolase [Solwaraspora sp. WMMA2056]WJK38428.1 alpha/beta hydrolase [Solwaraspora sp. WMMA2056]
MIGANVSFSFDYQPGDAARPPVVFMSALFAGGWIWDHPYTSLARSGWGVLRTREAICALDSKIAGSIERLGEELLAAADAAGIGAFVLCANSLGGLVAIDMSSRYPDRIAGIVVSGAPGLTPDPDVGLNMDRRASVQLAGDEFRERMLDALFHRGRHFTEEQIEQTAQLLRRPAAMVSMARSLKATRRFDVTAAVDRTSCPALYVWGRYDRMTPIDPWLALLSDRPDTEFVVVEECGHIPMAERPDEYTSVLEGFLSRRAGLPV